MRMAGPDIVLFVAGAVLFGGATFAIISLDDAGGDTSALGVFQVSFRATDQELTRESANMRSSTVDVQVNEGLSRRLVSLTVTVACDDPAGAAVPFAVQLRVEGPNGQSADGSGSCGGGIDVVVPVADLPAATVAPGSTEADARTYVDENVGASGNATAAVGTWTVTVSGGRSGAPVGLPVGDPNGTVAVTAQVWEPQFAAVQR